MKEMHVLVGKKHLKMLCSEIGVDDISISNSALKEIDVFLKEQLKKILYSATHWRGPDLNTRLRDTHIKIALDEIVNVEHKSLNMTNTSNKI